VTFLDLRAFLGRLERERLLQRVDAPVNPHLESTALSLRALRGHGQRAQVEFVDRRGNRRGGSGSVRGKSHAVIATAWPRPRADLGQRSRGCLPCHSSCNHSRASSRPKPSAR
jgi:4-hydroxy-3-polyprenylbenzoate decarboxylase